MLYSLDTSILIEAWRRQYPIDVFPALWQRLGELIDAGDLVATEEVMVELEKKDDELLGWVKTKPQLVQPIDELQQQVVRQILASHPKLVDTRKNRSGADPFVIALAQVNGLTVLTYESPSGNPERPHIPDVCTALGVPYMDLLGLFRVQGWSFS